MMMNVTFIGLMAPVFTIFNPDFSINTERVPAYAHYLLDAGINGILIAGTNGEGPLLSISERKSLAEAWVKAVRHTSQHLMVQVGGACLPDVLELARHADTIGANSILVLPEIYYKPSTTQQLITYLKYVSAAAPRTPLYYYHYPSFNGVNLDMVDFLRLADNQLPNLKGMKFTSTDMGSSYAAFRAAGKRYQIMIGGDYVVGPSFAVGFKGAISSSLNVFHKYFRGMLKAYKNNQLQLAKSLQRNLTNAMDIVSSYGATVSGLKLAMNLFTPINVGLARPPLENPSPYMIEEAKYRLAPYLSKR